jgi:hypothetical protein
MSLGDRVQVPINIKLASQIWERYSAEGFDVSQSVEAALNELLHPKPMNPPLGEKIFLAVAGSVLRPYEFVVWDRVASRTNDNIFPVVVRWDGKSHDKIMGTYLWQFQFRMGGHEYPVVVGPGAMIYCKMVDNE